MQQADFTLISREIPCTMPCRICTESRRNPSRIQAESIRSLPMPNSCSKQVSPKVHADFSLISPKIPCTMQCRIYAESERNPSGIEAESFQNLPMPNPCLISYSKQISRSRNLSRILAESMWSPLLPMLMHAWFHAASRFQTNLTQISG